MKVIILAAGEGNRLRPYTDTKPKCLVEIGGKSLLDYQLDTLKKVNLNEIIVVAGHFAEKLEDKNVKIIINDNFKKTNMVSSLFCAENWIKNDEDLLITYGDIIYEERVIKTLLDSNSPITVSVDRKWKNLWEARMSDPLSDAETLKINKSGLITEIGRVPKNLDDIQGQYMGLIKIRGDAVSKLKKSWLAMKRLSRNRGHELKNIYMTDFLQQMINDGTHVAPAFTDAGWIEIDTAQDLELYNALYSSKKLDQFISL